ncbi:MAG: ankyrin repeat domain-containing protein [Puniceicoccales bacterium]|nr:ankyrin repeat domain-containing protein [Puniceicoccales bacterium]
MPSIIPNGSIVPIAEDSSKEDSGEEVNRSDRDEESRHQILHTLLTSLDSVRTGKARRNFMDLSPLYSVLTDDDTRDFATGKGHHEKHYYNALRVLWRYLFSIPDEEFTDVEIEEEEDWRNKCLAKVFPTTKQLKEVFTAPQLLRMDIALERLLEIENLRTLRKSREFTLEEIFLLDEATQVLDCSPEQYILDAISSASITPEEACETVKSIIETEDVDVNLPYKGIRLKESLFLHRAAAVSQDKGLEIVQFLLDHGADIDKLNEGEAALYCAIIWKNTEVARLLIDRGANVNIQTRRYDIDSRTPLHLALYCGNFEIARLLLAAGANSNIRNDKGETPFDMAMKAGEQIGDETERRKFYEALNELHLQTQ